MYSTEQDFSVLDTAVVQYILIYLELLALWRRRMGLVCILGVCCFSADLRSCVACSASMDRSLTSTSRWITTPDNQEAFLMSSILSQSSCQRDSHSHHLSYRDGASPAMFRSHSVLCPCVMYFVSNISVWKFVCAWWWVIEWVAMVIDDLTVSNEWIRKVLTVDKERFIAWRFRQSRFHEVPLRKVERYGSHLIHGLGLSWKR